MIGHVSGLPVEELVPALLGGGGAGVLLWLRSMTSRQPGRAAARRCRRDPADGE